MAKSQLVYYDIKVKEQPDGWLVVTVPDLPPVTTQAARMDDVEHLARHAIAQWLEHSPDFVIVNLVD